MARKILLGLASVVAFILFCYLVNICFYHYWAAGGPPTSVEQKAWHTKWGNIMAIQSLLTLGASVVLAAMAIRKKREG